MITLQRRNILFGMVEDLVIPGYTIAMSEGEFVTAVDECGRAFCVEEVGANYVLIAL